MEVDMFNWKKEALRYQKMLRREFPSKCPICSREMKLGYMTGLLIKWIPKEPEKRPFIDSVLMPDTRFHRYAFTYNVMPGFNCAECKLIVVKYNPSHRKSASLPEKKRKKRDFCPYCDREMKHGRIYGVRTGIWWSERMGNGWWGVGKSELIEPFPMFRNVGVATRRCNDCGIIFSKYKIYTHEYNRQRIAGVSIIIPILLLILWFMWLI